MNGISIFLAEGENHVRQAIRISLDQQEGINVSGEARHAESLLAQVGQHPPDVILLDWHLPGMNPQRLLSVLKEFCPGTKIIATVMQPKIGKLALTYGLNAYLLKGLPPDEFVKSLKEQLNNP